MPEQLEILNSHSHRDVGMHPVAGTHPHCVRLVLGEFGHAATCCPLFFVKDADTGRFNVVALFGFQPGEVLAAGADSGRPLFIPLELVRQGFFIEGEHIVIDRNHPRFAANGPVRLFDADGEATDEMRLIQRGIGTLIGSQAETEAFVAEMVRLRLVESIDISLRFDDGEALTLEGLYTISLDALSDLDDADVVRLFRNGYLAAALCIEGSRRQVAVLARRRNDLLAA